MNIYHKVQAMLCKQVIACTVFMSVMLYGQPAYAQLHLDFGKTSPLQKASDC